MSHVSIFIPLQSVVHYTCNLLRAIFYKETWKLWEVEKNEDGAKWKSLEHISVQEQTYEKQPDVVFDLLERNFEEDRMQVMNANQPRGNWKSSHVKGTHPETDKRTRVVHI